MSGSRLGRGRGGRLAVYGGCGVVVILLVFLYRAATSEMARLRELHVQCAHQQEALAAQLQVIFEYKVRLEKSLAEEKSSNAAVKQELQQRASREKSLRDKDSIEAMQRFNSLQQTYKLLQTENQDLQEECKKREKQALEDTNRLEATLQDLRSKIKQARDEKERSLENLKNKYLELDTEKTKLEDKYQEMLKSNGNTDSIIEHLKKEVFQLKRELEEAKKPSPSSKVTSPGPSLVSPQSSQQAEHQSVVRPSQQQQQQVSRQTNDDEMFPQPLHAPRNHHAIGAALSSNEKADVDAPSNEQDDNIRFAQKNNNIVPVGPNDPQDAEVRDSLRLPYGFQERYLKKEVDDTLEKAEKENEIREQEQSRQVMSPPSKSKLEPNDKTSTSNLIVRSIESVPTASADQRDSPLKSQMSLDELQNLQDQVAGILNQP